jgi:hypothetical protein
MKIWQALLLTLIISCATGLLMGIYVPDAPSVVVFVVSALIAIMAWELLGGQE